MTEKDKKITSLSSFRAKKEPAEPEPPENPMESVDEPEMVPGFDQMSKKAQEVVKETFHNAQGFLRYVDERSDQVMNVAGKIKELLESIEEESGVMVAALMINACAGSQYVGIGPAEGSIIFTSLYHQIALHVPESKGPDKPN